MSNTALVALIVLELAGLIGLFVLSRKAAERRATGKPRPGRLVRISVALFGLLVVLAFPVVMLVSIFNPVIWPERQNQKLVETGTPATAVIHDIEETGTIINNRPEVRASMTVQPEAGTAFDSHATWVFTVKDVQTYRVGTKVKVFFDPEDHQSIAVVGLAVD